MSLETPWTVVCQAPLSMGFSRQEYWSGFPFPSPRDLSDPGIKPTSPALAGGFFTTEPPGKPPAKLVSVSTERQKRQRNREREGGRREGKKEKKKERKKEGREESKKLPLCTLFSQ